MPYLTTLEMVTADRIIVDRRMLVDLIGRGLARASGGRPIYVIVHDHRRGDMVIQAMESAELAPLIADEAMALAERFILPVRVETNEHVVAKLQDYLSRMPKVTRPLAEQALKEALEEIVKLRTALAL